MSELRFAIFGTGFWSRFQMAAWKELTGARCVALYNRTRSKAEALAREFHVPAVYDDPEALLDREQLDFIDVITDVDSHSRFVHLAAGRGIPVICQKPMAPTLADAEALVVACRRAGVPFAVHENFRWQTPLRKLKQLLNENVIGEVFRGHVQFVSSYPVFENQPFLKDLKQFILTDVGSHVLDVARFLFGEAESLYCKTHRVHKDIRGEDVATVILQMRQGSTVICEMSYATRWERERFPQTFCLIEGERGTIELGPDFWIRVTTQEGTYATCHPPRALQWMPHDYLVVMSSIVACNADMLRALQQGVPAETSGEDNLKTVQLVFASYESAASGQPVRL